MVTVLCPLFAHAQIASSAATITLPILTYHYVEPVQGMTRRGATLTVTPAVFEHQLQALQGRGYETIFVKDIPSIFSRVPSSSFSNSQYTNPHLSTVALAKVEPTSIALTFDDGYEDFALFVLPLLRQYRMKATFYVVTDFVGKQGYVTAEELQEIIASGLVEIGAHTVHHKNLLNISLTLARDEIEGSKHALEQDYGLSVQTFAYPYGKHSPRIDALVQDAGFSAAVTTERGYDLHPQQLFALKRIPAEAFVGNRKWRAIGMTP